MLQRKNMASICARFCLFIIFNLCGLIASDDDINRKTSSRCEQICDDDELNIDLKYKPDCERGCRYFNIEFLTAASNTEKVTDLNTTENQCKSSCEQAYGDQISSRNACNVGCNKMFIIQSKAPYVHGWLVYMGASDRSMVLMQPDFELESEDDWILLDSVFHPHDYESNGESYKLTETRVQTMPIYPMRKNIRMDFCIPAWMWMVPVLLVLTLLWLQYGHSIRSIFIYDDFMGNPQDYIDVNNVLLKDKKLPNDYIVAVDSFFYPSPAVPPPNYSSLEELLITDSEDDIATKMPVKYNVMA